MTPLTLQYILFEAESRIVKAALLSKKRKTLHLKKKKIQQSDIYYRKIFQGTLLEKAEFNLDYVGFFKHKGKISTKCSR